MPVETREFWSAGRGTVFPESPGPVMREPAGAWRSGSSGAGFAGCGLRKSVLGSIVTVTGKTMTR